MPSILLVDDDGAVLDLLSGFFGKRSWSVHRAATGERAIQTYQAARPDLVVLDLNLPDQNGIEVLRRLREYDEDATVIMLTGHGDIETAVESMRIGAENFVTKPFELAHLEVLVARARETAKLRRRNRVLAGPRDGGGAAEALGVSEPMLELTGRMERIARGDGTVLLQGETGTGKGWVARRIHERSQRRGRPFVEVACGGLTPDMLASELFGHERGAFPAATTSREGLFEVADGGTVFLDEVGDLDPALQPKLLQVLADGRFRPLGGLRDRPVNVRVMAASSRDLREELERGRLREALYYRLAVLPLDLPPLRERAPEDIAALAYDILQELRRRIRRGPDRFDDRALAALARHDWPGNIRELRNLIERILILAGDEEVVRTAHLPANMQADRAGSHEEARDLTLEEVERRHIARVLEINQGNRSQSARALGISRAALYDKMDRYGLRAVGR